MSSLSFWVDIDPCCVAALTGKRVLKDFVDCRIRFVLLLVHYDRDITSGSSRSVKARSISFVLGHSCVGVDTGLGRTPLDVAAGLNRVIQIGVGKNGAM